MSMYGRRVTDEELITLVGKVRDLDSELRQLRIDFDAQIIVNTESHNVMVKTMNAVQDKVDTMMDELLKHASEEGLTLERFNVAIASLNQTMEALTKDLKEPMEVYKAAKLGIIMAKFVAETAKWLGPLLIGLVLGYTALSTFDITNTMYHIIHDESKAIPPKVEELKPQIKELGK